MEKTNISDLFYYIKKPQEQIERETSQNTNIATTTTTTTTTTECHDSTHPQISTQNHIVETKSLKLSNFDLSSTYDRFVRPYKEKGVKMDPSCFPYIDRLPGKMKIVADKSLRKLVNKSSKRKKWNEKYPPEKYPLDSKTIECNMLNLLRPGIIPGFDPAEYGLVDGLVDGEIKTSSHNNNIIINNRSAVNNNEMVPHHSFLLDRDDKSSNEKKKKRHKNEYDYEGERKRKHKEHKTNGKDGEYKKKKRKMERERTLI
ncbi:hypothetical protein Glove_668g14 [Diversispora epigaea]|uniref:Mediator of RNA polymerase II transcription subunit 19 n=1 Tax=Diversispora epigaea TaxID=1348612 RepID=A0A397GC18_9GLOM|nr:hypothetical protein Glove_668g14 [Diversispora epigaea]